MREEQASGSFNRNPIGMRVSSAVHSIGRHRDDEHKDDSFLRRMNRGSDTVPLKVMTSASRCRDYDETGRLENPPYGD